MQSYSTDGEGGNTTIPSPGGHQNSPFRGWDYMIPHRVGKLDPNSTYFTRGLVKYVSEGAIFLPSPPKTGENSYVRWCLIYFCPGFAFEYSVVFRVESLFYCTRYFLQNRNKEGNSLFLSSFRPDLRWRCHFAKDERIRDRNNPGDKLGICGALQNHIFPSLEPETRPGDFRG